MTQQILDHQIFKPAHAIADFAVLEIAGWGRDHSIYVPHFAEPIGQQYNLYLTNLREKGAGNGTDIVEDLIETDEHVRTLFDTNNIVYLGHSAAASLMLVAAKQHQRPVLGYFCMNMFPNFPEIYGSTLVPDDTINQLFSSIVQHRASKLVPTFVRNKICPASLDDLAYSLDGVPNICFVSSEQDGIIQQRFPSARERLFNFYKTKGELVRIRGKRDHLYNMHGENNFNESAPDELLNAAYRFLTLQTAAAQRLV